MADMVLTESLGLARLYSWVKDERLEMKENALFSQVLIVKYMRCSHPENSKAVIHSALPTQLILMNGVC